MSRDMTIAIAAAAMAAMCTGLLGAQGAPQAPPPAPPAQPAPAAQQPPPAAGQGQGTGGYTYDPAGRRDPFLTLLGRGGDPRSAASRPAGLAGILINEVNLKGIMKDRSGFVAIVQGPDNKTYVVKPGDKLMDGSVKSIDAGAVVFSQDVNDPLSLIKQREIRKSLRSEESRG